jgi:thiosulfate/3-mercaptopyruvate sulfurtransferase
MDARMTPPVSPLVDPAWIAERLDDPTVRVVEVDVSRAAHDQGHIPGAVLWNAYADLRHPDYSPIGTAQFEHLLSTSGATPETTIVFYGYAAHLGYWLLRAHGHSELRLLDGPRDQWREAGHRWSVEGPPPTPTSYSPLPENSPLRSSRADVEALLEDAGGVILDVRSQAEYDGERFWPSGATEGAGRAGHIPGSVHVPIDLLRTEGRFRATDEIRQTLLRHEAGPDRRVVAYCTIGNRASQAWFAMTELLRYPDARVYYGSWVEWGTRSDTPIEP